MHVSENASSDAIRGGRLDGAKFDYGALPSSVARFLHGQADRIRRQCANSVIQIGKALIESKRHLSHGGFIHWVESEVGIPARTAQAYMRAANWASGKSATVAHLPPSALYLLSAPNVPEEFVHDILRRVEAGEQIAPSVVQGELKAFRGRPKAGSGYTQSNGKGRIVSFHQENQTRSEIAELAAFLSRTLSAGDFARVCRTFTSDKVLSDPRLAENLGMVFRSAAVNCIPVRACG
jgi:hypothetical protein